MRDETFQKAKPVQDFVFNEEVAAVFDDMLERSVPYYREVQRMVVELAVHFLEDSGTFYDVGCSTGNTMVALAAALDPQKATRLIGLEPSEAMRSRALQKLSALSCAERTEILPSPIEDMDELEDARVITMLYTLQFVRPVHRRKVLQMCQNSLHKGGCLIVVEKILAEDSGVRRLFIDLYHQYKIRSGYSTMEISRKREALENVLIPFTGLENVSLLRKVGFSAVEPFFQWYNFTAYLAVKT